MKPPVRVDGVVHRVGAGQLAERVPRKRRGVPAPHSRTLWIASRYLRTDTESRRWISMIAVMQGAALSQDFINTPAVSG